MPYNQTAELPEEVKAQLPQHAQQIFVAAFNAGQSNGMNEESARELAWNSVKNEYQPGNDGKWHRKPEDPATHHKAVVSGGN
jgi:cation transport regulator